MKTSPTLATLVLLILAAVPLTAANTDLLSLVPADAEAVLVTEPLDQLSKHFDAFGRAARLPVMPPDQAFSFEQHIAQMTGAQVNIDGSRGLALAVTSLMGASQTLVVLLPVTDAQAFVKAAAAEQVAQSENLWSMPDGETYLLPLKKYVALSPDTNALIAYQNASHGLKLSAANAQLVNTNQAAAVIKLRSVTPMAGMMLMMQAQQQLQNNQAGQSPATAGLMQLAAQRIGELESLAIGLRFDDAGAYVQQNLQAVAGSTLASYLAGSPTTSVEPLNKLPAGSVVGASVISLDKKMLADPLLTVFSLLGSDANVDRQSLDNLNTKLTALAEVFLDQPIAGGTYLSSDAAQPGNIRIGHLAQAEKVLALVRESMPLLGKIAEQAGSPLPFSYQAQAGKMGDTPYDAVATTVPQASPTRFIAAVGKNKLVSADSEGAFKEALQLAQGQGALGQDPAIAQAAQKIAPQANCFVFVNMSLLSQAFAGQMQSASPPAGFLGQGFVDALAKLRGTCAASATLSDGRLESQTFVPAEFVRTTIAAFMQFQMTRMQQQMQAEPQPQP